MRPASEIHSKLPDGTTVARDVAAGKDEMSVSEYDCLSGLSLLFARAQEEAEGVSFAHCEWREGRGLDGYSCCEIGEETRGFWSVRDCHAPPQGGLARARIGLGGAVGWARCRERVCLRERGGFVGPVA